MRKFNKLWFLSFIAVLGMAAVLLGCPVTEETPSPGATETPSESPIASPGPSPSPGETPAPGAPLLEFVRPAANATVDAGNVTVEVNVSNFNLVDKLGQPPVPGEGHIHYFLDFPPPTTAGEPAIPPAGVKWVATANTTYTFANVTAGNHTAYAELVNNDHTPLTPPVLANVTFTAKGPMIEITKPQANSTVPLGNVTVEVKVSDFNLVDKLGQPPVAGEGHIHYFLDFPAPTTPGKPAIPPEGTEWVATANTTYTFMDVTAGNHTIWVELVNNNHTPLVPPAVANVTFSVGNVTSGGPAGGAQSVDIDLTAKDLAFDKSTISVPASAPVTINFKNDDDGIPHNFAVYKTPAATETIFKGKIITGVSSITNDFTAPSQPGDYYFQCDVHPFMNGTLKVT